MAGSLGSDARVAALKHLGLRLGLAALVAAAAAAPAAALTINATYDSTVTSSASKNAIEFAFNTIISQYEALFTNDVTVTLTLGLGPTGLGSNVSQQQPTTYNEFVSALQSTAAAGNQPAQTFLASLPAGPTAPVGGTDQMMISTANAKAVGIISGASFDATITITNSPFTTVQFTRVDGQIGKNNFDFFSTAEHELDEVLGLGSSLDFGGGFVKPEDLMRFAPNSTARSFVLTPSEMAFLSINGGANDLVQLNQDSSGDFGDFLSKGPNVLCTARVQNAFLCAGQVASVSPSSVEVQALAAIGWNPRFSTAPTATVWAVDCNANTIASSGAVVTAATAVTHPLSALLGAPTHGPTFGATPQPGDVVEITGICIDDATVTVSGLMLTNSAGPDGLANSDSDAIQGQLEIAGAQGVVVTGLLLGNFNGSFSFASSDDLATLFVHDGASVTLMHSDVGNSPAAGVLARRQANLTVYDTRFFFNGFDTASPAVAVLSGSKATLGAVDGSLAIDIRGSGGDGVMVDVASSVVVHAAHIHQNAGRQIALGRGSSALLSGSGVTVELQSCFSLRFTPCGNAIEASGTSALRIEGGARVLANDSSSSAAGAIVLSQGSELLAQGAVLAALSQAIVILARDNSVIALAGGNTVCSGTLAGSCSIGAGGKAVELDHVATFIQLAPAAFGYAAAQDKVFGGASVQLQSTVDLGVGLVAASPSLAWTTGGFITVQQNSSFRLQGGVAITGQLFLSQGSNGFFNVANGGTNSVSGGVVCPFATIAAAHVAAPNAASLSPLPVLATTAFPTDGTQCLPF
jgi:hypothetical protein